MKGLEYTRQFLRAPLREYCLFEDEGFVHKARIANVSEGGVRIDQIAHFPSASSIMMMFPIPQFPEFKNFNLIRLKSFSSEMFPRKIIKVQGEMVRRVGITTAVDDVFDASIAVSFVDLAAANKSIIDEYVVKTCGNIICLLKLIDGSAAYSEYGESARLLAAILGYTNNLKLSELRKVVEHDYKSLQWP